MRVSIVVLSSDRLTALTLPTVKTEAADANSETRPPRSFPQCETTDTDPAPAAESYLRSIVGQHVGITWLQSPTGIEQAYGACELTEQQPMYSGIDAQWTRVADLIAWRDTQPHNSQFRRAVDVALCMTLSRLCTAEMLQPLGLLPMDKLLALRTLVRYDAATWKGLLPTEYVKRWCLQQSVPEPVFTTVVALWKKGSGTAARQQRYNGRCLLPHRKLCLTTQHASLQSKDELVAKENAALMTMLLLMNKLDTRSGIVELQPIWKAVSQPFTPSVTGVKRGAVDGSEQDGKKQKADVVDEASNDFAAQQLQAAARQFGGREAITTLKEWCDKNKWVQPLYSFEASTEDGTRLYSCRISMPNHPEIQDIIAGPYDNQKLAKKAAAVLMMQYLHSQDLWGQPVMYDTAV